MAQTVVQRPVSVQDKLELLTERYSQAVDRYRCIHIIRSDKHRCTDRVQTSNYRMCIRFVNFYIYIPACFQYSIITFLYFISLWCWFVGGDDLTGALHVIAPAVTTTFYLLTLLTPPPSSLSPVQNGDILGSAYLVSLCLSLHFNGHFPGESGLAGVY